MYGEFTRRNALIYAKPALSPLNFYAKCPFYDRYTTTNRKSRKPLKTKDPPIFCPIQNRPFKIPALHKYS